MHSDYCYHAARRPTYKLHWLYFVLCFINFFHKVFLYKFRRRYSSITFHYNCEKGTQKFARFCCICFFVFVSLSFSKLFRRNLVLILKSFGWKIEIFVFWCVCENKRRKQYNMLVRGSQSAKCTHNIISIPWPSVIPIYVVVVVELCCCLLLTRCCCL